MFFYVLYKLGYIISNILPLRAAYWFAERIIDLRYSIAKEDRVAVMRNLSIVLNKDVGECRLLAREVFRSFALYIVDFFRMGRLTKEDIRKKVRVEGLENLEGALKREKGVIALSAHVGNWEMGAVVIALMGYDLSIVVLTHMHKGIDDFFIGQRERHGLKVLRVKSVMKRCISALVNKGILALMGDRDFTDSGIKLDFFGVPTSIPKGPAALSLKTNAAIVPIFFIRENRYNYRLIFAEAIEPGPIQNMDKSELHKNSLKKCIAVMEKYIRKYPEQWLMFRNFWETPADAFVI